MLMIIPLLNISDPDISLSLGVQLVHQLGVLNASDPATYESGLLLAINQVITRLPAIDITFNGGETYYTNKHLMDTLREEEKIQYSYNTNGFLTEITYDMKDNSIASALYSIYTTAFIMVLLIGGIYIFQQDVQNLVITPIEKLVKLVKQIAENPLGVEYKMLGEQDGFQEGMETTILLTTINKIGGLMKVGFGEAGAAIIAKNLSDSGGGGKGKLNLLGTGTMINSIFGFCDVRQFTDTTECLQEEVMLFVNRIAHILHSIVVQCSGAANKNIGDAFLLTWKIDEKSNKEQKALLADQALLTFCKALIELARHQEFICNFSVAATGRLFKRFPEYKVRIGSGLHVGWAIEGAIGSHRKIDATYISPHVSASEFLESSTKEYGVSLLMSEPFYKMLSPAASRYIRQVDRIRRSVEEGPFGLYTYDSDLSIDWNDPFRHGKTNSKAEVKSKLRNAARRASTMSASDKAALKNGQAMDLAPISEHSGSFSLTTTGASAANARRTSRDSNDRHDPTGGRRRGSVAMKSFVPDAIGEVDEENVEAEEEDAQNRMEKAKATPTMIVPPYTQNIWNEDQDLVDLRHLVDDSMRSVWAEGMDAFIIGDWVRAKEKFNGTLRMCKKKDGPSKKLLDYMEEHGGADGSAPEDWHGFCDLSGDGGH
jgi:class 3 adenylate cyclase